MTATPERAGTGRIHRAATGGVALAIFALAVWLRSHGLADNLLFLGDQVRDWRTALLPFGDLPWHGPPSLAGGFTLGPIFYWTLWTVARVVSWFGPPLPHLGVAAFAVLTAAADAALLIAVSRRFRNLPLAAAMSVLLVTSPFDLTLDRTIWNPNLALALVKVFLAILLGGAGPGVATARWAAAVLVGWLAIQAHSTAAWVVVPGLTWVVLSSPTRGTRTAATTIGVAVAIIVVLQIPVLTHLATGNQLLPGRLLSGQSGLAAADRWRETLLAMLAAVRRILFEFGPIWASNAALAFAAIVVCIRYRRDGLLLALSIGPFLVCLPAMAMWTGTHDQYWFRTIVPSAALLLTAALAALGGTSALGRRVVGLLALAAAVASAPARIQGLDRYERTTDYGVMLRASRVLAASQVPVAGIEASWMHHSADENVLFTLLGGRFADDGQVAVIARDGQITWKERKK